MHEAMFYQPADHGAVDCHLCCHRCHIAVGRRGICGVRENNQGRLQSLVYGKLVSQHVDPIEKKPLFHFLPGSRSLSIATMGCNFRCLHCQNYQISQYPHSHQGGIAGTDTRPEEVVAGALATGCASISYTYVEPTIFYEFASDCASLAHKQGIKNVFVSNGYMTPEVARDLAPCLDAINIDIKAFTNDFYRKICKARLEPVLDNIRLFHQLGVLVEVTTLVIPGLNDSEEELRAIADFLAGISTDIPWHLSGFHPTFQLLDRPRTTAAALRQAREIGLAAGLHYVYLGNVADAGGEDTRCPGCGTVLIRRTGFQAEQLALTDGCCSSCQQPIVGVWG